MNIVNILLDEVKKLTADQLLNAFEAAAKLEPDDVVVGRIWSDDARALWVIADDYLARMELTKHAWQNDNLCEEHRNELLAVGARLISIEGIIRDMAWFQMREEVGGQGWSGQFALHKDGYLIRMPEELEITPLALKLPPAFVEGLLAGIRGERLTRPSPKVKRKPQ